MPAAAATVHNSCVVLLYYLLHCMRIRPLDRAVVSHALLACNFRTTVQLQQSHQQSAYSSLRNSRQSSASAAVAAAVAAAERSYVVFKYRKDLCPHASTSSSKSSSQHYSTQQHRAQSQAAAAIDKCIEVSSLSRRCMIVIHSGAALVSAARSLVC
jgi:hypothetical protein